MLVWFDIETTGLDFDKDEFRCGVVEDEAGVVTVFTDAPAMASHLLALGATCVTFNGAAFDFPFLAAKMASPFERAQLAQMTSSSIDIMFDFLCHHGYRASMNSFGTALGTEKTWDGASAAVSQDLPAIIEYCKADVALLRRVYEVGVAEKKLSRVSVKQRKSTWALPQDGAFRTVAVALADVTRAPPDQSWMTEPTDITSTLAWVGRALSEAMQSPPQAGHRTSTPP